MAIPKSNFVFLAIILAAAAIRPLTATITKTTQFNSYNSTVSKLNNINERLTVLRAVWAEIRADEHHNMELTKTYYDNLLAQTKTAVNAEAEEAAELAAEVRQVLVTVNGRLLAETLNQNNSQKIVAVQAFRTQLLQKYNVELTSAIFEQAIDAAYPFKSTDHLHAELNAIDLSPENVNSYKLRVNWNLYLYYKFLQRGDINDKYVFEAALTLRNLKYSSLFKTLSSDLTRRIAAVFESLPSSLNTLFNSTAVCLENAYNNYFLYFAESTATTSIYYVPAIVRNRYEVRTNDRRVWRNSFADPLNYKDRYLNLKLKFNSWFLYKENTNTAVVVQKTDNSASLRNWVPSLVDNKIMFEQRGFFLCATSTFVPDLLGFAVHALSGVKADNTGCQWILSDCSRI